MMFFKNIFIFIFIKFFWVGMLFGLAKIVFELADRFFHNNIYSYNLLSFVFWLTFGMAFVFLCNNYYNSSFCWFGLVGMFMGLILIKHSINFLLTSFIILVYHKLRKNNLREKTQWKKIVKLENYKT